MGLFLTGSGNSGLLAASDVASTVDPDKTSFDVANGLHLHKGTGCDDHGTEK